MRFALITVALAWSLLVSVPPALGSPQSPEADRVAADLIAGVRHNEQLLRTSTIRLRVQAPKEDWQAHVYRVNKGDDFYRGQWNLKLVGSDTPDVPTTEFFSFHDRGQAYAALHNVRSSGGVQVVSRAEDIARFRRIARWDWEGFLFGGVQVRGPRLHSIADLAESGEVTLLPDVVVDGVECKVLRSESEFGVLTLWIAPNLDHNILRWVMVSPAGNVIYTVDRVSLKRVATGDVDERYMPVGGRIRRQQANGKDYETFVRVDEIDLTPELPADFFSSSRILEGANVRHSDFPESGVRRVWQDGGPVIAIDAETAAEIRRQVEALRPSLLKRRSTVAVMSVVAAVLAVLSILVVAQRRRQAAA